MCVGAVSEGAGAEAFLFLLALVAHICIQYNLAVVLLLGPAG